MTEESLMPCVECGVPCKIMDIQLGDFYTLVYLRLCSVDCLFKLSYNFLHGLYEHNNFVNSLFELEHDADKKLRQTVQDEMTELAHSELKKCLQENTIPLNAPIPSILSDKFSNKRRIPLNSGKILLFKRYNISKHDRIECQKKYIQSLRDKLSIALRELEDISQKEDS